MDEGQEMSGAILCIWACLVIHFCVFIGIFVYFLFLVFILMYLYFQLLLPSLEENDMVLFFYCIV